MFIYFFVLVSVISWVILEKESFSRKAFWVPLLFLSFFASIRSHFIGTDTSAYTSNFRNALDPDYYYFRQNLEYGYQFFEYSLLKITYNYFWLFFISSIIVVGSYLYIFKKQSQDYLLSIIIFICFGYYLFYFNGLRQGLAMAITALATPYLIEKKFLRYVMIVFLASLFHKTALIMILFYFLIHLKIKFELKAICIFLGSFLISGPVIQYIASTNEKYASYTATSEVRGGYLTLFFYFLISLFIYFYYKKYNLKDNTYYVLMQLHIYGILLLIPVSVLGADPSGPQRLLYYFVWASTLLIPIILNKFNNMSIYLGFIFLAFIYYSIVLRFGNLMPYQLNETFRIF